MDKLLAILESEHANVLRVETATADLWWAAIEVRGLGRQIFTMGRHGPTPRKALEALEEAVIEFFARPDPPVVMRRTRIEYRPWRHEDGHELESWFLVCDVCAALLSGPFDTPGEAMDARKTLVEPCACWAEEWEEEQRVAVH
jgi:hypothetical protein